MCTMKRFRDFLDLATRIRRSKVDGGTNGQSTKIKTLFNLRKQGLFVHRWQGQGFVVIELDHKGDAMRVTARNRAQDTKR